LGERGSYFYQSAAAKDCLYGGQARSGLVPAVKTHVVDTTGAGDAFVGHYALDLAMSDKGRFDVARAIERATKVASVAVSRAGTQPSMPFQEEVFGV